MVERRHVEQDETVVENRQDEDAEQSSYQRTHTTCETDATEHDGGDHLQFEAEAGVRLPGVEA